MSGDNLDPLTSFITDLLAQAQASNHRRCVVIAGEQNWTRQITNKFLEQLSGKDIAWVSTSPPENASIIEPTKIQNILGSETDNIIFDAYSGFNPDLFGAASGIIRAGGLLLLLTPKLNEWQNFNDPEYKRITVYPTAADEMTGRFLKRLSNIIQNHQQTILIEQDKQLPTFTEQSDKTQTRSVNETYRTNDQKLAVEAIKKVVTGHRRRPLVLTSDRGRGKSAALGIAAAQLIQQGIDQIIVTAPRTDTTKILFEHTAKNLAGSIVSKHRIKTDKSTLAFFPPDELVRNDHKAKLLLVDEAAAIPAPILEQLLKKYSRIVFASTIHGYEGTGRGFAIRFHQKLNDITPSWKQLEMKSPIRWADNDPLEDLTFKLLLLDSNIVSNDQRKNIKPSGCKLELIDREKLVDDENSLQQLFGLLTNAHYQTKPSDLRDLLDGANLSIFVLRDNQTILATVLIAKEGGFDTDMANKISSGKRRPHGHLIPEILATHQGLKNAPLLLGARIVRIAVHPSFQNAGFGTFLLEKIKNHPSLKSYDYIASCFGATMDLLHFWKKSNYALIRIGLQRNASSGEHSALMFNPISSSGKELLHLSCRQFFKQLSCQLSDSLQDLETNIVEFLLLQEQAGTSDLDAMDRESIEAFVNNERIYEACPASIIKLVLFIFKHENLSGLISREQKDLLIRKVIQKHSWQRIVDSSNFSGKKNILEHLRKSLLPYVTIDL